MKNKLETLVNSLLHPLGLQTLRSKAYQRLTMQEAVYRELLNLRSDPPAAGHGIEGIVFSRDRAIQLHALLDSYLQRVAQCPKLYILYTCTTEQHRQAYREVASLLQGANIVWHAETDFREDLLKLLGELVASRVFFLVDDIVFIRDVDFTELCHYPTERYVPSLRLGRNISRSYTARTAIDLPEFVSDELIGADKLAWRWQASHVDWGYPLSVDGHIFDRDEIRIMARRAHFSAPNSFEKALKAFKGIFSERLGVCYSESRIVNLPINKVQTENDNLCGNVDVDFLLQQWQAGYQIDIQALYEVDNCSVHQELPIRFVRR